MEYNVKENIERIGRLAQEDEIYRTLLTRCKRLELQFDKIISLLETKDQDLLWEFVMLTEARCNRKLELACTYMTLSEQEK